MNSNSLFRDSDLDLIHAKLVTKQNIAEMWKNHFAQLYNSVNCDSDAVACTKSLSLMGDDKVTVSIGEVVEAIGKQVNRLGQTALIVRPTYMVVLG